MLSQLPFPAAAVRGSEIAPPVSTQSSWWGFKIRNLGTSRFR